MLFPSQNRSVIPTVTNVASFKSLKAKTIMYSKLKKKLAFVTPLILALATEISLSNIPAQALQFNFNRPTGMSNDVFNAFDAAGNIWEGLLDDDATVNIKIGYASTVASNSLAETSVQHSSYTYSQFKDKLNTDQQSANDSQAVNALPSDSSFNIWLNYTSNNPNGLGNGTAYLDNDRDANNTTVRMTRANAKALSLLGGSDSNEDASIVLNSNKQWDFDRSDGISNSKYDIVGTIAHEIGHALGFMSGIDYLDVNSPDPGGDYYPDNQFKYVAPMDLFRFSANSVAQGLGVVDFTSNNTDKYFSLTGGVTPFTESLTGKQAYFSTGKRGNGFQNNHWKDNSIGLMGPSVQSGKGLAMTYTDLRLLDVIGWDRIPGAVPAPAPLTGVPEPSAVLGLMALGSGLLLKRAKQNKSEQ
ncbi:MAG TPA: NF038122 family metalloprotease [Oculatellaceae cyanobacterium]|jgi:hypothetical protein